MSQELIGLPYYKVQKLLVDKDISVVELIKSYIETAKNANVKYNVYREITEEYALNQAQESQKRFDNGKALKIEAMPIGVKDNYCTKGILTTACSKMLESFILMVDTAAMMFEVINNAPDRVLDGFERREVFHHVIGTFTRSFDNFFKKLFLELQFKFF